MKKNPELRSHCPINYALEIFGDKWSLLIIRDIVFRGKDSFNQFKKSQEAIATNILATRLEKLLSWGILEKTANLEDGRKEHYHLTQKGLDLIPIILEMVLWSYEYDNDSEAKKIKKLVELIRKDNRKISEKVKKQVKEGIGIVYEYLDDQD